MSSDKRLAANRTNAQHSTGPRSSAGKRRSAVNALRHGLSVCIDTSPLAVHAPPIQAWLEAEGYTEALARDLAMRILNFERNLAHLRTVTAEAGAFYGTSTHDLRPENEHFERASQASLLLADPSMVGPKKLLRTVVRFARAHQALGQAEVERSEARLRRADRHVRRAANQLIKGLRRLKQ